MVANTKKNSKVGNKGVKKQGKKKPSLLRKWWFWTIIAVVVIGIVVGIVCALVAKQQKEREQQEREEAIAKCVTETKKDALGFVSVCYEENGVEIPEDAREADKRRVDRILAQAEYDRCMASAAFRREVLWDMNDNDRMNGKMDSSRYAEYVEDTYKQYVEECKVSSPLLEAYEKRFKTDYKMEFDGWEEPIDYSRLSDNVPMINRYNADGIILEWSFMPADEEVTDKNLTVGGQRAEEFKDKHLDWWY